MSADLDKRWEQITSEVERIVEDAVEKVHRIVSSGHSEDRRLAVGLFRLHSKQYCQELLARAASDDAAKNKSWAVEAMESILRSEFTPEQLAAAGLTTSSSKSPSAQVMENKRQTLLLYREYCKLGVNKAEFVRRLIRVNKILVPKTQRKGIRGTEFKNVYRELDRLLRNSG
jgi:hypothetical protein